jgi:hypothetical protein
MKSRFLFDSLVNVTAKKEATVLPEPISPAVNVGQQQSMSGSKSLVSDMLLKDPFSVMDSSKSPQKVVDSPTVRLFWRRRPWILLNQRARHLLK